MYNCDYTIKVSKKTYLCVNYLAMNNCGFIVVFNLIFVLLGIVLYTFPPKKITPLYGYRTKKSMSNQRSWDFAQKHSSKLVIFLFSILVIMTLLLQNFINTNPWSIFIFFALDLASIIFVFFSTERKLSALS